jgi:NitT/TauT family transport system substrate-binding protein
MSCCDEASARLPDRDVSRRAVLKGAALISAVVPGLHAGRADAQAKKVTLAFCSQLLCIIPYEVARAGGHFARYGLDVELIYTRGGGAAMQALVGGAVDYAATALDVAIQAFAKGADIRRFATTGRLPLFAVATAPKTAAHIQSLKELEGKTVGVSALGNADHALLLFLLKQAQADVGKVQFATLGVNLLEALRQGQIDAGLVQEPALTLLRQAGARVLVNAMDSDDAQKYLGGDYEFMGVAVRAAEFEQRRTEMTDLAKGLADGLMALRGLKPDDIAGVLPKELTAGMDRALLGAIVARYRESLYPQTVNIDLASARRVAESLKTGGLLPVGADVSKLHDTSIVGG